MLSRRRCVERFGGYRCHKGSGHPGECEAWDDSGSKISWPASTTPNSRIKKETIFDERYKLETKTQTEPITGWRWWRVGKRGLLKSMTSDYYWHGPVGSVKKTSGGELATVTKGNPIGDYNARELVRRDNFDWGVFSYKSPELFRKHNPTLFERLELLERHYLVCGQIEIPSGQVIEHAYGYRSQLVVMRELWVFHSDIDFVFNTAWKTLTEKRYGCNVNFVHQSKLDGWIKLYSEPEEPGSSDA